jgi:hypothetical protein
LQDLVLELAPSGGLGFGAFDLVVEMVVVPCQRVELFVQR